MLQGSLLLKVTPRRAKERRYRLQEDGVTVVSERRFGRMASKHSCECWHWGWGHWCGFGMAPSVAGWANPNPNPNPDPIWDPDSNLRPLLVMPYGPHLKTGFVPQPWTSASQCIPWHSILFHCLPAPCVSYCLPVHPSVPPCILVHLSAFHCIQCIPSPLCASSTSHGLPVPPSISHCIPE